MKQTALDQCTVDQLVQRFMQIALQQHEAELDDDTARYNRLYQDMADIRSELKGRSGDQRRALTRLYDHPNAQVRLKAAISTLALAPSAAREVLRIIAERKEFPQAADASGMIRALDDGTYKPT